MPPRTATCLALCERAEDVAALVLSQIHRPPAFLPSPSHAYTRGPLTPFACAPAAKPMVAALLAADPGLLTDHRVLRAALLTVRDDKGHLLPHAAAAAGHPDALRYILDLAGQDARDAALDARDTESGWTPVHTACYYGRIRNLVVLLRAGATLSARDWDGELPADLLRLRFATFQTTLIRGSTMDAAVSVIQASYGSVTETPPPDPVSTHAGDANSRTESTGWNWKEHSDPIALPPAGVCEILVWGNGASMQLGAAASARGVDATARRLLLAAGDEVDLPAYPGDGAVATGKHHSLFVTRSGRVMAVGAGKYGVLGSGRNGTSSRSGNGARTRTRSRLNSRSHVQDSDYVATDPQLVALGGLGDVRVRRVAASATRSAAITDAGELFIWGGCDVNANSVGYPVPIVDSSCPSESVAANTNSTAASTAGLQDAHINKSGVNSVCAGSIAVNGLLCAPSAPLTANNHSNVTSAKHGISHSQVTRHSSIPERVIRGGIKHTKIVHVALADHFWLAVDSAGFVWGCGDNSSGSLALDETVRFVEIPKKIPAIHPNRGPVRRVVVGRGIQGTGSDCLVAAVLRSGDVLVWAGPAGRAPRKLTLDGPKRSCVASRVLDVAVGDGFVICVTVAGKVHACASFGTNRPLIATQLSGLRRCHAVKAVACGRRVVLLDYAGDAWELDIGLYDLDERHIVVKPVTPPVRVEGIRGAICLDIGKSHAVALIGPTHTFDERGHLLSLDPKYLRYRRRRFDGFDSGKHSGLANRTLTFESSQRNSLSNNFPLYSADALVHSDHADDLADLDDGEWLSTADDNDDVPNNALRSPESASSSSSISLDMTGENGGRALIRSRSGSRENGAPNRHPNSRRSSVSPFSHYSSSLRHSFRRRRFARTSSPDQSAATNKFSSSRFCDSQIRTLKNMCEDQIFLSCSLSTVLDMLRFAFDSYAYRLRDRCLKFLSENFDRVLMIHGGRESISSMDLDHLTVIEAALRGEAVVAAEEEALGVGMSANLPDASDQGVSIPDDLEAYSLTKEAASKKLTRIQKKLHSIERIENRLSRGEDVDSDALVKASHRNALEQEAGAIERFLQSGCFAMATSENNHNIGIAPSSQDGAEEDIIEDSRSPTRDSSDIDQGLRANESGGVTVHAASTASSGSCPCSQDCNEHTHLSDRSLFQTLSASSAKSNLPTSRLTCEYTLRASCGRMSREFSPLIPLRGTESSARDVGNCGPDVTRSVSVSQSAESILGSTAAFDSATVFSPLSAQISLSPMAHFSQVGYRSSPSGAVDRTRVGDLLDSSLPSTPISPMDTYVEEGQNSNVERDQIIRTGSMGAVDVPDTAESCSSAIAVGKRRTKGNRKMVITVGALHTSSSPGIQSSFPSSPSYPYPEPSFGFQRKSVTNSPFRPNISCRAESVEVTTQRPTGGKHALNAWGSQPAPSRKLTLKPSSMTSIPPADSASSSLLSIQKEQELEEKAARELARRSDNFCFELAESRHFSGSSSDGAASSGRPAHMSAVRVITNAGSSSSTNMPGTPHAVSMSEFLQRSSPLKIQGTGRRKCRQHGPGEVRTTWGSESPTTNAWNNGPGSAGATCGSLDRVVSFREIQQAEETERSAIGSSSPRTNGSWMMLPGDYRKVGKNIRLIEEEELALKANFKNETNAGLRGSSSSCDR